MHNSLLFFILAGLFLVQSCGNKDSRKSFSDVVEYNDYIIDQVNEVDQHYSDALNNSTSEEEGLKACDSLFAVSNRALVRLQDLQPYKNDSTLCESAKGFVNHFSMISKRELPQFFARIFNTNRTEADQAEIDHRAAFLDQHYEAEMDHFNLVQKALSTKFNFQINK